MKSLRPRMLSFKEEEENEKYGRSRMDVSWKGKGEVRWHVVYSQMLLLVDYMLSFSIFLN